MGFWNTLLGGTDQTPEEEKKEQEAKNFDLLKYDGVKALKMGQTEYGIRCFREALKLKDDLETHDYLSQALLRQGELGDALTELQTLADAEPQNLDILLRMAQVAYLQEDYDKMGTICERALQVDSTSPQVHYLYAQNNIGQGNIAKAIAILTKAITLNENYADAYLLRGQNLLALGDIAGATADADWLMERVADHEDVLLLKARTEEARGNTAEAISLYDRMVELNPFCLEAFQERGRLKFVLGDKAGATADMEKLLELDPNKLADVSGEFSAEGIEQRVRQAYSAVNPLGL